MEGAATYRAVQAVSPGKLELTEKPVIDPPEGHVRIRVEACGVCHSDSATVEGILPIEWPRVPGHEAVGRIDAIGEGVQGWKMGQRVGVGFLGGSCGYCVYCRDGDLVNCTNQGYTGVQHDGGYAEMMIAKSSGLIAVPDDLSATLDAYTKAGARLVDRAENVVMLRTFSKIYALAALRLGWAYCPPAIADVLNRVRGPFNVSAVAQAVGVAALEDTEALRRAQEHNNHWLPWLNERLAALDLDPTPSVGNFVLPRFPDDPRHNADAAFEFLQSRNIIARKMGGYQLPDRIRITIGTAEENRKVAAVLAEFMAS